MNKIVVTRGDTKELTLTLVDDQGGPYDLTNVDVWFSVGSLLSKRLGAGIAVPTPALGVATITLDAGDTGSAPDHRQSYPYDVQLELANGSIVTPLRGRFIVVPDVTTETD